MSFADRQIDPATGVDPGVDTVRLEPVERGDAPGRERDVLGRDFQFDRRRVTALELRRVGAEFPGAYGPKVNYTFTENAFTGATTHGGGIEIGASSAQTVTAARTSGRSQARS